MALIAVHVTPLRAQMDIESAEALQAALDEADGIRMDLNRARPDQLAALPGFTPEIVEAIVRRRRREPFVRLAQLSSLPEMDADVFELAAPYLHTRPTVARLDAHYQVRLTRPAGMADAAGSLRLLQRFDANLDGLGELRLLVERDPGESSVADHAGGYLELTNVPGFRTLTLGALKPAAGMGLVFSRRTRSAVGPGQARMLSEARAGDASTSENGTPVGFVADRAIGPLTVAIGVGRARWDASEEPGGHVPRGDGTHVSELQRARRDRLTESLLFGRGRIHAGASVIGFTFSRSLFARPLLLPTGPAHTVASYAADLVTRRGPLTVSAEVAVANVAESGRPPSFRHAATGAVVLRGHAIRVESGCRIFRPGYHAVRSAPAAAFGPPCENEFGVFAGIAWRPATGWRVEADLDRFRQRVPRALEVPDRGTRWRARVSRTRASSGAFDLRIAASHDLHAVAGALGERARKSLRLRWRGPDAVLRPSCWVESVRVASSGGPAAAWGSGVALRLGRFLSLWSSFFTVSDWDARLYTFEPDVWGGSRLTALSGRGVSGGARLTVTRGPLRLAARYARTSSGGDTWAAQVDIAR